MRRIRHRDRARGTWYTFHYMQSDANQKIEEADRKLLGLEQKIDAIYASVEKTRKYFLWTMILSIVFFVLPLIGLAFALPAFMNSYVG